MEEYRISPELEKKLVASIPAWTEIFTPPFRMSEAVAVVETFIEPLVLEFAPAATAEEYFEMEMAIWKWYEGRLGIVQKVDDLIRPEDFLPKNILGRLGALAIERVDGTIFKRFVEGVLIPQSAVYLSKYVG